MKNLKYIRRILNKIFGSENKDFRGSHIPNDFISFIKGYEELKEVSRDATGLYREIEGIQNALYPPMQKPGHKPGYVTYSEEFFEINHSKKTIRDDLTSHLLDKNYSEKIYSNAYDLSMFFEFICRELITEGKTFYAVVWDKVKINNREYTLPIDFCYLHPSTISLKENEKGKILLIKQRYPFWSIIRDQFDGIYNRNVKPREAFYLSYPFSDESPAKQSLRYASMTKKFYNFGLYQGEASLSSKNHRLPVELSRYTTFSIEKLKHDLTRIKIRKNFSYLYEQQVTTYYDVYSVVRYMKYLNNFRQFLLDEFNKQIMLQIKKRNKLKKMPIIQLKDDIFVTNQKIDEAFARFQNKEINVQEFSKQTKDNLVIK